MNVSSSFGRDDQQANNISNIALDLNRQRENRMAAQTNKLKAEIAAGKAGIAALEPEIAQLRFDFALYADLYAVETLTAPDGTPTPTVFAKHRSYVHFSRNAKYATYLASIVLLAYLTWRYMSVPVEWQIGFVITVFVIMIGFLPGLLALQFNVNDKQPESILPVKKALVIGAALATAGLLLFNVTRTSSATAGLAVTLYGISLSIAELGFGVCAACFDLATEFYYWSLRITTKYKALMKQADTLRAEIASLEAQLPEQSSPTTSSDEGSGSHVN